MFFDNKVRFNSNIINSGKYLTLWKQTIKQIKDKFIQVKY